MIDVRLDDPAMIADPYPTYARLRDRAPVVRLDPDVWVLTRYDDVVAAMRDHERFSSDLGSLARGMRANPFNPSIRVPRGLGALAARIPWLRVLLTSDPPEHTAMRRKVARAFTPRMISAWEPRIREIAEQLVARLGSVHGPGRTDLVRDFGSPLPTIVIAEMMGVPATRHADFKRWSDNLVNGLVAGGSRVRLASSALEITAYFARTVRARRKRPGDDLISLLVTGDSDLALTGTELIAFCVLLLVAGNETTTNLVANAVLALLDGDDTQRRVALDPDFAASVVEEVLRFDNPGQGLIRVTTRDVTIGEVTIPAGSNVLAMVGSANRDPGHWDSPDEFVPERRPNDHLGFATGIHLCLGAPLARLESRVALEVLFREVKELRAAGPVERIPSPVLRGLRSLPVSFAS